MSSKPVLPSLTQVILNVKLLRELTPQEELVYYTQIEKIPEEEARKILGDSLIVPPDNNYASRGS